jgi:hypothetical protein
MSRWFRFYDAVADDPKVQRLSAVLFRTWINVLCIASRNAGRLPKPADMAFTLRLSEKETALALAGLVSAGLIDKDENGFYPHNWNARQFKSDNVAERVRKHREKRRCNVTGNTPETETEADKKGSEAKASGGEPPVDEQFENDVVAVVVGDKPFATPAPPAIALPETPRERLWRLGRPALMALGVKERLCGEMIGRWLRDASGDFERVLNAILLAREACPSGPIGWITATLKPEKSDARKNQTVSSAASELREWVAEQERARQQPRPVLAISSSVLDGTADEKLHRRAASG